MQSGVVSLIVISDIVCPWCYIGLRELQKAIRDVADCNLKIKVEHRPFFLHPTAAEDYASDKHTWYEEKFGTEKLDQIKSVVTSRAKEVGIEIVFDGFMCQTIRAHRLSRKAYEVGGQEVQEKYLDVIFHAYFTEGKNICDYDVLGELAEQAGVMSKEEAIEYLKSPEHGAEVEQMAMDARKKGVTGVPFTIINGKWAVSGGQSAEVYAQIFRKLAGKGPLHPIPDAPSCNSGTCPHAVAAAAVKS
ncbi:thioredoxin-like protein [Fomes fomentarius]|nr:thioredoxin-like protein [Fomes fomentarius]